jgi:hypothetical protein
MLRAARIARDAFPRKVRRTAGPSATLRFGRDDKGEVVLPSEIGRRRSELQITWLLNNRPIPWQRPFLFNCPLPFCHREWSWACVPPKVIEKRLGPATTLYSTYALPFVIPTEAEGPAVLLTIRGNVLLTPKSNRPGHTPEPVLYLQQSIYCERE